MSSGQRIAIIVVAVVVLVGGFVLAQGSDDDGGGSEQAATTQTSPTEPEAATDEAPPTTTEETPPPPRVETIRIEDGGPAGEARTLEYDSGEIVRLRFESNEAAEVHIHGYDKTVNVPAGGTARTRFKANAEGIFEIEEHHSEELLAKLQVQP